MTGLYFSFRAIAGSRTELWEGGDGVKEKKPENWKGKEGGRERENQQCSYVSVVTVLFL